MKAQKRGDVSQLVSPSRWALYAAAGAATAVAAAPSAEADIHYSGIINQRVVDTEVVLPLDANDTLSFVQGNNEARVLIDDGASNGAFVGPAPFYGSLYVSNLGRGVNLATQLFRDLCVGSASSTRTCRAIGVIGNGSGYFQQPGTGAIGFRFIGNDGVHYGWARIKTTGAPDYHLIIVDYAWGDAGQRIRVGQTQAGRANARNTPDLGSLGSLGLLAAGAVGLRTWRRAR